MQRVRFLICAACVSAMMPTASGDILYVDADVPTPSGGESWCSAYADLQDALAVAQSGDEIRIAAGTYKPDRDTGDPLESFEIPIGVTVKGGYAGCGDANPNQRDIALFETILSGDLIGDDADDLANMDDNSFTVVRTSFASTSTILDGLTVQSGNGNGPCCDYDRGGGVANFLGSPTISNCTFRYNAATSGGAIFNNASDAKIVNCTFLHNESAAGGGAINNYNAQVQIEGGYFSSNGTSAAPGGAILNNHSDVTVTGAVFSENTAPAGAAVAYAQDSCGSLLSCTFQNNTTSSGGGALYLSYATDLDIQSCSFTGNISSFSSGGAVAAISSMPRLTHCVFDENGCLGTGSGGAIQLAIGGATFDHCVFRNNYSSLGAAGAIIAQTTAGVTARHCAFEGNYAERGGAVYAASGPFLFDGCSFDQNEAFQDDGGAIYVAYDGLATVARCNFTNNIAFRNGGGIVIQSDGHADLFNCRFTGNIADEGGGASTDYRGSSTFFSCTFVANDALSYGGGAHTYYQTTSKYTNCTFTANGAPTGQGLYNAADTTEITNCILWNNNGSSRHDQITGNSTDVSFSCVQGGHTGTGNIFDDPRFINTNGPDGIPGTDDDDLRLRPDSPCINVGTNALQPDLADLDDDGDTTESVPIDTAGHARILCAITDMGAHEFGLGDFNCDQALTSADFAAWHTCLTGPNATAYPAGCVALDADYDANIDLADFAAMQEITARAE